MKLYSGKTILFLFGAILFLSGASVFAQEKTDRQYKKWDFCAGDNWSYNGKSSFKELRETTTTAGNLLEVDGQRNGGITIKGENRNDILIRSCIQTSGKTEQEAEALAKNIRITNGSMIRAENAPDDNNWGVSYEIHVPRSTNLKLTTHNGGISISGVNAMTEFEAKNGGITLSDLAGDVKGKTTNGGVRVDLSGSSWNGAGLDVQTTNGGISLSMPENYAAHIETKTVNGGFKSDLANLNVERKERTYGANVNTDFNGGGAPIRVVTTNGGVRIDSSTKNF